MPAPSRDDSIRGTVRGTPERQRALIATIPVTIGYEITHVKIALIHFCAALAMSLPNIIRDDASDGGDDLMQMLLGTPLLVLNVVLIYSIHIYSKFYCCCCWRIST